MLSVAPKAMDALAQLATRKSICGGTMNCFIAYRALPGLFAAGLLAACGGGANGPPPAPIATVHQSTLPFGSELVGTTEAAKVVTVLNTGNAPLDVSGISLTGT